MELGTYKSDSGLSDLMLIRFILKIHHRNSLRGADMLTPEQKAIFNKWVRDYQDEEHNPFTITLNQRELMIAEHAWEAALPPAVPQGWQPIETAPKGAKGYAWMQLAWGPEDDKNTGYGMHANGKFYAVATFHCLGQERQYQMREIEVVPTHWMPLPAAPAMAKEKA